VNNKFTIDELIRDINEVIVKKGWMPWKLVSLRINRNTMYQLLTEDDRGVNPV